MKVKVKYTNENSKELYLKASNGKHDVPFKTYNEDFCYDVVATSCEEVAPNVYKYGIGLAFQIERGWETIIKNEIIGEESTLKNSTAIDLTRCPLNLSIDFRPRSSVWKTGMILSNCEGSIDELYIGQVYACFYHVFTNMQKFEVGDKIGQIKIGITFPIDFEVVEELNNTSRGDNGYGSTGK